MSALDTRVLLSNMDSALQIASAGADQTTEDIDIICILLRGSNRDLWIFICKADL